MFYQCISFSFFFFFVIKTLRKKGFNGCDSPEPDGEDSIDQSPLNDDKYRKTTEDLDVLFKRYGVSDPTWISITNLHIYVIHNILELLFWFSLDCVKRFPCLLRLCLARMPTWVLCRIVYHILSSYHWIQIYCLNFVLFIHSSYANLCYILRAC